MQGPQPSQPATFFRRLSIKLRSSSPRLIRTPTAVSNGAALPNYLAAKGKREAALRERGLLPPKDLSEQERDLDSDSSLESISSEDSGNETAAKKIKAEWEANNRQRDEEQLNKFNFGADQSKDPLEAKVTPAPPSITTPSTTKDLEPDPPRVSLKDVTPPCSPPLATPRPSRSPPQTLLITPQPPIQSNLSPPSPNALEPWSIPLPPSPVLRSSPGPSSPSCSPSTSNLNTHSSSPLTSPTSPSNQYHLELPQSPSRTRTRSAPPLPSLSESDSIAPSSIATPSSPVDASCPPEIRDNGSPTSPRKERLALGIKVRTAQDYDGHNIPMIVESPVDEDMVAPPVPNSTDDQPADGATTTASPPTPRPRLFTDPGAAQEHRRSFLGFRTDGLPRAAPSRRSSMANLRSVVGSLRSRPSKQAPKFDPSRLPPSPTIPETLASSPRQPLSPTIHSLASILQNTRDIEDEESRRLSEMAFLD